MELINLPRKNPTEIGVISMIMLVAGTFAEPSSLIQKFLFLMPGPMLAYTAYATHQKMFFALQAVVTAGVLLSFFPTIPYLFKYTAVVGMGIVAVGYLTEKRYIREDRYWPISGIGILVLAFGYSTNAASEPLIFNGLLVAGSILVATYSAIGYVRLRIKVALIWLLLNLMFIIQPLAIIMSHVRI